ncbi:MAG: hypothetical protein PUD07_02240 [bacterium]|nr:hypothetical protein [bacterium]
MINKVYYINNRKIYVYCEVDEYCKKIENWMNIYDTIDNNDYNLYIKIYNNKLIWNIDGNEKVINKKINQTDLYPLFYNLLSNVINNESNLLLHSAVLFYNSSGILVVGDFNSGKTSLCLKALKNNVEVLSTDQTNLYYENNKIMFKKGSTYMKIDKDNYLFIKSHDCNVEIKVIINLIGICDFGKVNFDLIRNKEHIIKTLFRSCTWHSDIPFSTDNKVFLKIDRENIYKWLSKINVPLYNVRGDSLKIIEKLKEGKLK